MTLAKLTRSQRQKHASVLQIVAPGSMLRQAARALSRRAESLQQQATRSLSTASASASKELSFDDAPSTQGIQGRYAAALFSAGKKANALDAVDKDLTQIRALAAQSPAFAAFLKDRSVAKAAKGRQLEAILSDLKAADLTKNFMSLLVANNRLSEISRVAATFGSLVAHSRGQVTAVVTTADPLAADEAEEILKGLSEVLPKGKTLQLSTNVDPSIIGGVVVDIGDKHIDLSIASRVKQVEQLIAAGLN